MDSIASDPSQSLPGTDNLFPFIVNSLCPSIWGQELVKAGLVLTLFGGCAKFSDDKNKATKQAVHPQFADLCFRFMCEATLTY